MKKMTLKHIIIKLFKIRMKIKSLTGRRHGTYKAANIRVADISSKPIQWRRPWSKTLDH